MAWTNAAILGIGAIMIAVPILLHLLMQPKPKLLAFPALRFVKERQQSNRSRMRLRHLLLLLLRCLLIALVVLALAGPSVASNEFGNWLTVGGIGFSALVVAVVLAAAFWAAHRNPVLIGVLVVLLIGHLAYGGWSAMKLLNSESAELLGDSRAPVAALVLIDTSPRMSYVSENQSRLDRAKEMGDWLIAQLPVDSQIAVLATDMDRPFFSVDVGAARKRVSTLGITHAGATLPDTLDNGFSIFDEAVHPRKEIYLVTDLTKQSWMAESAERVSRRLQDQPDISVFVIDVGVENPTNFQLSSLDLSRENMTQSGGVTITTDLNRVGPAAQRTVRMRIEKPDPRLPRIVDGQRVLPNEFWERTATVDVRENNAAMVQFRFDDAIPTGVHHGTVEVIGEDALSVDDRRYFTLQVRPSWPVLVVRPAGVNWTNLQAAIAPGQDINPGQSSYDFTVINQRDIARQDFNEYKLVVLLDPEPIQNSTWSKLRDFVAGGGGLGVFLGHNAARGPFADESFLTETAVEVLGARLTTQWTRPRDPPSPVFISPNNLSHPVFKEFRTIETGVPWHLCWVFRHWGIEPDDNPNNHPTQVLAPFGNGRAAMIERNIGAGRVVTLLTPITDPLNPDDGREPWNELFAQSWPAWLLVEQTASYLVQANAETLNLEVGQIASLENDKRRHPVQYRVFTPREQQTPASLDVNENELKYRFTSTPGHYRFKGTFNDQPVTRGFSSNLAVEATNLDRMDVDQLDAILGAGKYQLAREEKEIQRQQGTTRSGKEFYPLLILMMVIVLAVENMTSNRFYQSRTTSS